MEIDTKKEVLEEESCIFCEIVRGRAPAGRILETSRLLVITAREGGYPLILTKEHFDNLLDPRLDNGTVEELGLMQRDMAKIVAQVDGVEGVSIIANNGHSAGQEIPHLHIHIMPRVAGDRKIRITLGTAVPMEERYSRAALYKQAIDNLQNNLQNA